MSEQLPPRGNWAEARTPPAFNVPAIVAAVIAVLVAIHVGLWFLGESWQVWSLYALALIPARFTVAGYPMPEGAQYWSLVTYMLLHGSWTHLLLNCVWLLVFGTPAARYLGNGKFLLLMLVSGAAGGLCSLVLHWGQDMIVVGASGGVMGLMGAATPLMYGGRLPDGGWRPARFSELLRNRQALVFTGVVLAITLFSGGTGWTGNSFPAEGSIAWEAHIGGFIAGIFAFYALAPRVRAA
ncbi:rhomboid family intramembrane serine protease [Aestuariivirga sp.]|uniref:rhomboid family intramembrane serine protease n=1 Tax=Aestuariivirga sp. TaxID=2650926 RepID=UPI0025BBE8D1|nr:rhomboid family intramembrane serine protease [Aestuariivirga sp.]MCA3555813.1 rhomboid family intramembrane serine protease [Aestuariivirga sp.]